MALAFSVLKVTLIEMGESTPLLILRPGPFTFALEVPVYKGTFIDAPMFISYFPEALACPLVLMPVAFIIVVFVIILLALTVSHVVQKVTNVNTDLVLQLPMTKFHVVFPLTCIYTGTFLSGHPTKALFHSVVPISIIDAAFLSGFLAFARLFVILKITHIDATIF